MVAGCPWLSECPRSTAEGENTGIQSAKETNSKGQLEPVEVGRGPKWQADSSRTPIDRAETLPHPGLPAPDGRACRAPAPWSPALAVPGSAARSPAAPGRCRRVSAPSGHAALATGTALRGPSAPCLADRWTLPATARRRFKSQPLRGRGSGEERAPCCAQDRVGAATSHTAAGLLQYCMAPTPGWCVEHAGLGPGGADGRPSSQWHYVGAATWNVSQEI